MKRKGFTLIELMIVIAIIALLAAVALPKFATASEAAKVANVQGNLANLRTALAVAYAKQKAYPALSTAAYGISTTGNIGLTFQTYYSSTVMPETPPLTGATTGSRAVSANAGTTGGWRYIAASGEIRANLPSNAYGDNITWTNQ